MMVYVKMREMGDVMNSIKKLLGYCNGCNRFFVMKKESVTLLQNEEASILKVLHEPNLRGELMTKHQMFVDGERKTYEIVYVCRHCGNKQSEKIVKNIEKATN